MVFGVIGMRDELGDTLLRKVWIRIAEEIATEISTEHEIKTESEQEPEPIAVSSVAESSSAPEPQIDIMAKLKELSQMYQAGLLTDEEFTAAKRAVLSL